MNKIRIVTIVGARPQFVKAATVSRAIAEFNQSKGGVLIDEIIVHTGQHFDANMSDIFFDEMEIPKPKYTLGIGGGSHGQMTGRQLEKIEAVLLDVQPDFVLVYGDTNSTLAGALAASKLTIPVVHVEAGLRSYNRAMPEEINRVLTDHVSEILFAPTSNAKNNLINEGVEESRIHVVGDVMYDAALFYGKRANKPKWFDSTVGDKSDFFLATIHRAENTENSENLISIIEALKSSEVPVVLPLHPRTRKKLKELTVQLAGIHVVEPVGYLEMVWLEVECKMILTDSGGVQKEAFFHGKPCITLRAETEWTELVEQGFNKLVGHNKDEIIAQMKAPFEGVIEGEIYGDGNAAKAVVEIISKF